MVCAFLTLLMTLGGLGVLAFFAGQRLARHVRKDPEAAKQILDHVVLPLFEREEKPAEEETP